MNGLVDQLSGFSVWLIDYLLLASVLLLVVLAVLWALKQPVQRLAVTKSALAALGLVAMLCALPGWSIVHLIGAKQAASATSPPQPAAAAPAPMDGSLFIQPTNESLDATITPPPTPSTAAPDLRRTWSALPWRAIAEGTFAAGSAAVVIWLIIGALAARRLRLRAAPAGDELVALFNKVAGGPPHLPPLVISGEIDTALALGVFRPAVVLPRAWSDEKSPLELSSILTHEWTHVKNGDLAWLGVSRVLLVLLWVQPLYWQLRRRMRLDQEALADAAAADATGRQQYAAELVAWARAAIRRPRMPAAAAVGLWEGPSQLRRRIALLLDDRFTVLRSCSRRWRLSAALSLVTVATVLSLVTVQPQTLGQTEESETLAATAQDKAIAQPAAEPQTPAAAETASITGVVLKPDGTPAAREAVMAFVERRDEKTNIRFVFQNGETDVNGRFRLPVPAAPDAVFWVLPQQFSQQTHDIGERRGDLGTFKLQEGLRIHGRVTNVDGSPLPDVWVNAELSLGPAKVRYNAAVADQIRRTALTNADGRFELGPLPPGTYRVVPSINPDEPGPERQPRPLMATFLPKQIEITAARGLEDIDLRAIEPVTLEVLFLDSHGQPGEADSFFVNGRTPDGVSYSEFQNRATINPAIVTAPKGLSRPNIDFPYAGQRIRASSDAPFVRGHTVEFDALDGDRRGIEVTNYAATSLVLDIHDTERRPVPSAKVTAAYVPRTAESLAAEKEHGYKISGMETLGFDEQPDGRFRARHVVPDEKFTLTVTGDGYETITKEMSIAEGQTFEQGVMLSKPGQQAGLPAATMTSDRAAGPPATEINLIVAKNVMLLDGKKIVTREDVEKMLADMPKTPRPNVRWCMTPGVPQVQVMQDMQQWVEKLQLQTGVRWQVLTGPASKRFDAIEKDADLVPDAARRKVGTVETQDGKPLARAEIVCLTADDTNSGDDTCVFTLNDFRMTNRWQQPVTDSDEAGFFYIYPEKEKPFCIVVLHEAGFAVVRGDEFARDPVIRVAPWAHVSGTIKPDERYRQLFELMSSLPAAGDMPKVAIMLRPVFTDRLGPDGRYAWDYIPPGLTNQVVRNLMTAERKTVAGGVFRDFKLVAGEQMTMDVEPATDEEIAKYQQADREARAARGGGGNGGEPAAPGDRGKNLLRDIREAAEPILAQMAKNDGYNLLPGEVVERVAPPFPPSRMAYYRTGHPTQANAIPRGPEAMVFRWADERLQHGPAMSFNDPENPGYDLKGLLNSLANIKSQRIDGPAELLNKRLSGDWVVREGASDVELVKQLQGILQRESLLPVKLEFREVKRPMWVARGDYKFAPLAGQRGKDVTQLENETITSDIIQIFGKKLVPGSGAGGGTGGFGSFLDWLGRWIDAPIVAEVAADPTRVLSWSLHERSPSTAATRAEDHDPAAVLANITRQTGLTFTKEERPVRILFVERGE